MKKKIRLLVVDDQEDYCEAIKDYAEICSHQFEIICQFADSLDEVSKLMKSWEPSVMLVDAHVSTADCFMLIEACKKEAVPVIVTSDEQSPDIEDSSLSRGASGYRPKVDSPEELEMLLCQVESVASEYASRH